MRRRSAGAGEGIACRDIFRESRLLERIIPGIEDMLAAGENYVVWWPLYSMSPLISYNNYSVTNMKIIDMVVKDAQKKGVFLVFTVWDHPSLRAKGHAWGEGNWARNGFSDLGEIDAFFTAEEMWAWQANFYRYLIARWGYFPAFSILSCILLLAIPIFILGVKEEGRPSMTASKVFTR